VVNNDNPRAKPRLFFGNFDFEHRLAEPSSEPSAKLKRLNAELAVAWLSIAETEIGCGRQSRSTPSFFATSSSLICRRSILWLLCLRFRAMSN